MTRKRFVKLLMGCGVSRNSAHALAQSKPVDRSYASFIVTFPIGISMAFAEAGYALRKFRNALIETNKALANFREGCRNLKSLEEWY